MKKQIILIMTDTTRQDMVGCYGNPAVNTPNLDRLAGEGIRYTNAYTCQPVCGPARSAMFTGMYPHSNGSFANGIALGANNKTLGQRLTDNGIHCAFVGKWHLDGGDYFGLGSCPEGWDPEYWYDMRCYLEELTEEERRLSRKGSTRELGISADFTYGHRCADRAIDFVEKYKDEDFFLTVSFDEPHDPSLCPEPYASMFKDYEFPKAPNVWDTLEGKPEYQKIWAGENLKTNRDKIKICMDGLLGCNAFIDTEIGRVINAVRKNAPDSMIIYTSDHGEACESHCLNSKGAVMYKEVACIPLIVSGNRIGKNIVDAQPVSHIDLAPTIMEYMGLPIPKLLEGKSLLQAFENPEHRINSCVFTEFTRYEQELDGFGGLQMMRGAFDGRYKLVIHLLEDIDEFYDTLNDPYEMHNLIHSDELYEEKKRLHEEILDWMNRTRDPFRGYRWERRPWRKEDFRITWSYTGYARQRMDEEYEPRRLDYATGMPVEGANRKKSEESLK